MKEYIGDSIYVDYDGYHLVLTTENGMGPSNIIFIEPLVMENLIEYFTKKILTPTSKEQEIINDKLAK